MYCQCVLVCTSCVYLCVRETERESGEWTARSGWEHLGEDGKKAQAGQHTGSARQVCVCVCLCFKLCGGVGAMPLSLSLSVPSLSLSLPLSLSLCVYVSLSLSLSMCECVSV